MTDQAEPTTMQAAMEKAEADLSARADKSEKADKADVPRETKTDGAPADPPEWEGPGYTKKWKKEAREALAAFAQNPENAERWKALQGQLDETHQYMGQRDQMLSQYKRRYEPLNDLLSEAEQTWIRQGMTLDTGLRQQMAVAQSLAQDPDNTLAWLAQLYRPRDAAKFVQAIAQATGVDLAQVSQSQPYVDPTITQMVNPLVQEIQQLKQIAFNNQQQQVLQQQNYALQQIQSFENAQDASGKPAHPYLRDPEVFQMMLFAMNTGATPRDLSAAYEWATARHLPAIQEKAKAAEREALAAAARTSDVSQHAKNASNNLNGAAARGRPNAANVSMQEAMRMADKQLGLQGPTA